MKNKISVADIRRSCIGLNQSEVARLYGINRAVFFNAVRAGIIPEPKARYKTFKVYTSKQLEALDQLLSRFNVKEKTTLEIADETI
jgi:uncharacterized protein (UPF0254 family)